MDNSSDERSRNDSSVKPAPGYSAFEKSQNQKLKVSLGKFAKVGIFSFVISLFVLTYFTSRWNRPEKISEVSLENLDVSPSEFRPEPIVGKLNTAAGQEKTVADFRGKVVLLSFWSASCELCVPALVDLQRLKELVNSDDLLVVPVNLDQTPEELTLARNLWAKRNIPFDTFFDPQRMLAQNLGLDNLPSTYILDRKGRIAMVGSGVNEWSNERSQASVQQLLAENP